MEVINDQLLRWLMLFNAGPDVVPPKWCIEYQQPEDLETRAKRDQILVDMGLPYPVAHAQYVYQIPEPDGDEPVLKPIEKTANAANPDTMPPPGGSQFADIPSDIASGVEDTDRLAESSIRAAAQQIYAPLIKRILDQSAIALKKKSR
jgi:phage gp29-like protein